METILFANIINGFGVFFLILAHSMLSLADTKYNFIISAFGCFLVMVGSIMLKSYPVIWLNLIWRIISLWAYFDKNLLPENLSEKYLILLYISFIVGIISVGFHFTGLNLFIIDFENIAAYQTMFIYVFAYSLFVSKVIDKRQYLIWTTLGFFILFPHLILHFQYSVLFNEIFGAVVGILGIIRLNRKIKK